MMNLFLDAGRNNNKDYCFPLRQIKLKLEEALLEIGYKDNAAATSYMTTMKLMPKDICTLAEDLYSTRIDNGTWPPALSVQDARTPRQTMVQTMLKAPHLAPH